MNQILKKDATFSCGAEKENAVISRKHTLCTSPGPAFPVFSKPFVLFTDASGIGWVQSSRNVMNRRKKMRPIPCANRVLNKAERYYSATYQEAVAVVWVLRHFRDLINGYVIHILTDHGLATELFKGKELSGKFIQ